MLPCSIWGYTVLNRTGWCGHSSIDFDRLPPSRLEHPVAFPLERGVTGYPLRRPKTGNMALPIGHSGWIQTHGLQGRGGT